MNQKERLVKIVEIEEAIIGLRDDGLMHVYYKPGTEITVPLQLKTYDIFHELTKGKRIPFMFEGAADCSINKEARENAIRMEDSAPARASAVVVNNTAQKLVADFYYKFNKPKQPFKVVKTFEEGIKWLLTQ